MATVWAASVTKAVGMDYEEAKRPLQYGLITDFVLGTLALTAAICIFTGVPHFNSISTLGAYVMGGIGVALFASVVLTVIIATCCLKNRRKEKETPAPVEDSAAQLASTQQEVQTLRNQVSELTKEVGAVRRERGDALMQLQALRREFDQRRAAYEKEREIAAEAVLQERLDLEDQIKLLEERLGRTEQPAAEQMAALRREQEAALQKQQETLTREHRDLENQVARLEERLAAAKQPAAEQMAALRREQEAALQKQQETLTREHRDLENQVARLEERLAAAKQPESEQMAALRRKQEAAVQEQQETLTAAFLTAAFERRRIAHEKACEQDMWQSINEQLRNQRDQLQVGFDKAQAASSEKFAKEKRALEKQITALQDQLTAVRLPPRTPATATAEAQTTARPPTPTRPRRDSNPVQIGELNEQVRALRVEAAKLVREKEEALVATREAVTKSTTLEGTTKELQERIEARERDVFALGAEVERLTKELQAVGMEKANLTQQVGIQTEEHDMLLTEDADTRAALDVAPKFDTNRFGADGLERHLADIGTEAKEARCVRQMLDAANDKIRELEEELKAVAQETKEK